MWVFFALVAWIAAILSCARLCRAAVAAAQPPAASPRGRELSLYEAAFLSGGPRRVGDLALVLLARQRRVLLAHTGFTTVVDPEGRDAIERSLISSHGPEGQARVEEVRDTFAGGAAVRALGERLAAAGLAVPAAARLAVASSVRRVRAATGLTLLLAALGAATHPEGLSSVLVGWFAMPVVLTLGCLAIARVDVYPYTRWAAPAGQELLRTFRAPVTLPDRGREPTEDELLTALAVAGPAALPDPHLRAALRGGR